MEPLSSAVLSEVTIICPALFSLWDLCVSNFSIQDTAQGLDCLMAVRPCSAKSSPGEHTESIVSQRSVVRYAWSRVAAGASGRLTWTDWAVNHLEGVE